MSSYLNICSETTSCIQANIHIRRCLRLLCSTSRSCSCCTCCSLPTSSGPPSAPNTHAHPPDPVHFTEPGSYLGRSASRCTAADTNTVRHHLDLCYTLRSHSHTLHTQEVQTCFHTVAVTVLQAATLLTSPFLSSF